MNRHGPGLDVVSTGKEICVQGSLSLTEEGELTGESLGVSSVGPVRSSGAGAAVGLYTPASIERGEGVTSEKTGLSMEDTPLRRALLRGTVATAPRSWRMSALVWKEK